MRHYAKLIRDTSTALLTLVSIAGATVAGPVEDAVVTYERGDYATALQLLRPLAEQGNAVAQFNLGLMYDAGRGVPQNYVEAVKWYHLAADQGLADAQRNLGLLYTQGLGVPLDFVEAVKWYRKAADQGDAAAQSSLGMMYEYGRGVPQSFPEALEWYRKAADEGLAPAQYNLGLMYALGLGVPRDYVQAHMWLSLAVSRYPALGKKDRDKAVKTRDDVASKMRPAQIAEAQQAAREWKPKRER